MTIKNYRFGIPLAMGLVLAGAAIRDAANAPLFYAILGIAWLATVIVGYTLTQRRNARA